MPSSTPYQPVLPAEVPPTDAELNFMEESPPGLFPENQDSNFGFLIRKMFTDRLQVAISQIDTMFTERFVLTSTQFLDEWEEMVGLPQNPTGKTIQFRRNTVLGRIRGGPFTRTLRKEIVEGAISATFGEAPQLLPGGIELTAGGVPLFSGITNMAGTYNIVENISGFSYTIRILNTITIDEATMVRELTRITPAGISFTIVYVDDPYMTNTAAITATGGLITDATRATGVEGDGR